MYNSGGRNHGYLPSQKAVRVVSIHSVTKQENWLTGHDTITYSPCQWCIPRNRNKEYFPNDHIVDPSYADNGWGQRCSHRGDGLDVTKRDNPFPRDTLEQYVVIDCRPDFAATSVHVTGG